MLACLGAIDSWQLWLPGTPETLLGAVEQLLTGEHLEGAESDPPTHLTPPEVYYPQNPGAPTVLAPTLGTPAAAAAQVNRAGSGPWNSWQLDQQAPAQTASRSLTTRGSGSGAFGSYQTYPEAYPQGPGSEEWRVPAHRPAEYPPRQLSQGQQWSGRDRSTGSGAAASGGGYAARHAEQAAPFKQEWEEAPLLPRTRSPSGVPGGSADRVPSGTGRFPGSSAPNTGRLAAAAAPQRGEARGGPGARARPAAGPGVYLRKGDAPAGRAGLPEVQDGSLWEVANAFRDLTGESPTTFLDHWAARNGRNLEVVAGAGAVVSTTVYIDTKVRIARPRGF